MECLVGFGIVDSNIVIENHQEEERDADDVGENSELDVGDHFASVCG